LNDIFARARLSLVAVDIWDGSNNDPVITHGNTLCSKIKFRDVVEAIAKHAFESSDWPLILSLENHCSPPQQEVCGVWVE
jgi:hypothetical protein